MQRSVFPHVRAINYGGPGQNRTDALTGLQSVTLPSWLLAQTWSERSDSNRRRPVWQTGILAAELRSQNLEREEGVEPSSSGWRPEAPAAIPYPLMHNKLHSSQKWREQDDSNALVSIWRRPVFLLAY